MGATKRLVHFVQETRSSHTLLLVRMAWLDFFKYRAQGPPPYLLSQNGAGSRAGKSAFKKIFLF